MITNKIKMILLGIAFAGSIVVFLILKSWYYKVNNFNRIEHELNTTRDSVKTANRAILSLTYKLDTTEQSNINLRGDLGVYLGNSGKYQLVAKQWRDSTTKYKNLYFDCSLNQSEKSKKKNRFFN